MRRVFLIRHGESLANVDKTVNQSMADHVIPLSEKGEEQAKQAGLWLESLLPSLHPRINITTSLPRLRMWISPYQRTRQTADIIHNCIDKPLYYNLSKKEHPLLVEQQFGLFDGIPDEELPKRFPEEHAYYDKCEKFGGRFWAPMPLGESRFNVAQRVHQSFGTFHRDEDKNGIENIIVVSHGVVIRAFVMMWCHKTPEWFEQEKNPKNCSIRLIQNNEDQGYIYTGGL